jgi:histidine triad (HIT) family protein
MKETIFTKIANREIEAFIVHESEEFMAFLDIKPSVYGQTLVIPKQWRDSYVFNNDEEFMGRFMKYVRTVAKLLDERLGSERCLLMFEGYGVDHLHAKLYPVKSAQEAFDFSPRNKIDFNNEIGSEILAKISLNH